jgi:hypothetical protein
MQNQITVFNQYGATPLIKKLFAELGGKSDNYELFVQHIENSAQQSAKTFLPHLART